MSYYRQLLIVREAGRDIQLFKDRESLRKALREGIVYENKQKRYWIDDLGNDCYTLYPKELDITSSDKSAYWRWQPGESETEEVLAVNVKWLEVKGSFKTMRLSPDVTYKVTFQVKLDSGTNLKGKEVTVCLTTPDGTKKEERKKLPEDFDRWEKLDAGSFMMTKKNVGKMDFALRETDGTAKKGLVIKGVSIKAEYI